MSRPDGLECKNLIDRVRTYVAGGGDVYIRNEDAALLCDMVEKNFADAKADMMQIGIEAADKAGVEMLAQVKDALTKSQGYYDHAGRRLLAALCVWAFIIALIVGIAFYGVLT